MGILGTIERINGSLIRATFTEAPKIGDLVEVGNIKLMGEIVRLMDRPLSASAMRSQTVSDPANQ